MPNDPFAGYSPTPAAPYTDAVAVTPHDEEDLDTVTSAIYVGGAGNVSAVLVDGDEPVTFVGVPAGTLLPIRVSAVSETGTTATEIVALY